MLKLIIILLASILVIVHCNSNLGGYADRPDLLEDGSVYGLAQYASKRIAKQENLQLDHIKVTRVKTKVVSGIRYKLEFTAQSIKNNQSQLVNCQATLYMQVGTAISVINAQCEPKS